MQTLNIDCSTTLWIALNRARELDYHCTLVDQWITDAKIPAYPEAKVIWEDCRADSDDVVAELPDVLVVLSKERRNLRVCLYSQSQDTNRQWLDRLLVALPGSERQSNLLDVTFWYHSQHGPRSYDRQLEAPSWEQIQNNYPTGTRSRLTALKDISLEKESGKLLLWQGEPGTGKTFALRAIAEEWASWCRLHYVLDPEKFFTEGDYLLSVILGADRLSTSDESLWRLIVLEDAGEMLAKDAKLQVGQGLARLLNLCDGLLGQGLRVLVLITTNEQVGSLHAAVSRPGRCLSHVVFERFDSTAADIWLKQHGQPSRVVKQATLADLYAVSRGEEPFPKLVAGF